MAVIPDRWTPIAWSNGRGDWFENPDAVMTLVEARALYDDGQILMAQRRSAKSVMFQLVKRAAKRRPRTFFGSGGDLRIRPFFGVAEESSDAIVRAYGRCDV